MIKFRAGTSSSTPSSILSEGKVVSWLCCSARVILLFAFCGEKCVESGANFD